MNNLGRKSDMNPNNQNENTKNSKIWSYSSLAWSLLIAIGLLTLSLGIRYMMKYRSELAIL